MSRYVVDASVALKWLIQEEHSDAALRLRSRANDLLAPDLLSVEIANAMWMKFRREELSLAEARTGAEGGLRLPVLLQPARRLLDPAWNIATTYERSIYDSLYLALAVEEDAPLATAAVSSSMRFRTLLSRSTCSG